MIQFYFFLAGLNAFPLQFLHFTLPNRTLIILVRILRLQRLQTNMPLMTLAWASGNFTMFIHS